MRIAERCPSTSRQWASVRLGVSMTFKLRIRTTKRLRGGRPLAHRAPSRCWAQNPFDVRDFEYAIANTSALNTYSACPLQGERSW
jgi:hypothetical protein